jgi:hypothetical protein
MPGGGADPLGPTADRSKITPCQSPQPTRPSARHHIGRDFHEDFFVRRRAIFLRMGGGSIPAGNSLMVVISVITVNDFAIRDDQIHPDIVRFGGNSVRHHLFVEA